MPVDTNTLVALVSSRICHDLISPMAAVVTALDVMDQETNAEMREHALDVVRGSASDSKAKLEFLRAAFGSATIGEGDADLTQLARIARDYVATGKPVLDWQVREEHGPRVLGRILLHLVVIAMDCLARGGSITVTSASENGRQVFTVSAAGRRAELKPAVREALSGQVPEGGFEGRTVQPYIAFLAATSARAELAAREGDEHVELIVRMPPAA
jgi:histidine phosphotransferase ChpT